MKSGKRRLIPAIIIFLIGVGTIAGALFKIQYWSYGGEILTIGILIEVAGIIIAVITLVKIYKS